DPDELRALGAAIVLGNSYHLHFCPGADVIAALGGLHRFMGWDGPILTDSGGFQVFSLRHTILEADDDGVTFRSVYDGEAASFTPESVARIQAQLGSDIAMCLDAVPPADAPREALGDAVRLTTLWAARQRSADRAPGQLVFGIAQGGTDVELRTRSIDEITALDFDGYALGGLAIGEDRDLMFETVGWAAPLLPADRARYFMGIGDPQGVLEVIERGIDMFDCVRQARERRSSGASSPSTSARRSLDSGRRQKRRQYGLFDRDRGGVRASVAVRAAPAAPAFDGAAADAGHAPLGRRGDHGGRNPRLRASARRGGAEGR